MAMGCGGDGKRAPCCERRAACACASLPRATERERLATRCAAQDFSRASARGAAARPVGAIVELHSGEIGIVIARNPRMKLYPRVMVIYDVHKKPLKATKIIQEAGIKRTLPKGSVEIDTAKYFL